MGVSAVRSGSWPACLLAVITLVPLAAFELVSGLPTATQTLRACARVGGARVRGVRCPAAGGRALPAAPAARSLPMASACAGLRPGTPRAGRGCSTASISSSRPVGAWRSWAPAAPGKSTLAAVLLGFLPYQAGAVTLGGVEISQLVADEYRRVVGTRRPGCPRLRHHAAREPAARPAQRDRRAAERRACPGRAA